LGGDVSSDFRERVETSPVYQDVMEVPLNKDLGVVNPDTLAQHAPDRTPPQGFDQAVALHDALLEQLVRTLLRRPVQDQSGKNMKRL
jgi:hypothetical protein